jgi:hypothetical protein
MRLSKEDFLSLELTPSFTLKDLTKRGGLLYNLEALGAVLTNKYAEAVGKCTQLVLERAVPRAPVEDGELRESGTAVVEFKGRYSYAITTGKGKADGSIEKSDTRKLARVGRFGRIKKHGITYIAGNVFFQKTNEWGEDVALWSHEIMAPYTARKKPPGESPAPKVPLADMELGGAELAARTPGTGPKYLELAYLESFDEINRILNSAINERALIRELRK